MREIKFRFYDYKISKRMIYKEPMESMEILFAKWEETPKASPLMQFTGLHDKNGREIYEGDIIQICYDDDDWDTESYRSAVMWLGDGKWPEPAFDLDPQHLKRWLWHFDGNVLSTLASAEIYRYEVIGNIHENLELLNG